MSSLTEAHLGFGKYAAPSLLAVSRDLKEWQSQLETMIVSGTFGGYYRDPFLHFPLTTSKQKVRPSTLNPASRIPSTQDSFLGIENSDQFVPVAAVGPV